MPCRKIPAHRSSPRAARAGGGRKAGIAFATDEAEYRDLLMLRKFLESPCDSDFAAKLFSHYPDLSYGEFADRLFGDEEAEPSDDFILAFARAAVEVLEEIERRKLTDWGRHINALDPTVAEFRERLKRVPTRGGKQRPALPAVAARPFVSFREAARNGFRARQLGASIPAYRDMQ